MGIAHMIPRHPEYGVLAQDDGNHLVLTGSAGGVAIAPNRTRALVLTNSAEVHSAFERLIHNMALIVCGQFDVPGKSSGPFEIGLLPDGCVKNLPQKEVEDLCAVVARASLIFPMVSFERMSRFFSQLPLYFLYLKYFCIYIGNFSPATFVPGERKVSCGKFPRRDPTGNLKSGHIYSNSCILLNFHTNKSFTIQELPRSMYV